MEHVAFFIFLFILMMVFVFAKSAGNRTFNEDRLGLNKEPVKSFEEMAEEGKRLFEERAKEGKSILDIQSGRFEDSNIIIIDSRSTFNCPFNRQWLDDVVKVNSGYCRSACKRRNYKVKSPGDYFVACNKGTIK
jgi:hypothetical protein